MLLSRSNELTEIVCISIVAVAVLTSWVGTCAVDIERLQAIVRIEATSEGRMMY